jgi:hypothetical protein
MASSKSTRHSWSYFRAGEVNQVVLSTGEDLVHLHELDPKLWLALACPTRGLEFPERTLSLLDIDKDGRIRVPEILEAVRFVGEVFSDLGELYRGEETLSLASVNKGTATGKSLFAGATRILENLGKADAKAITLDDVADTSKIFAATKFNGDGIVPADATDDHAIHAAILDVINCLGQLPDRSGKPGVDQALVDQFFEEVKVFTEWQAKGQGIELLQKIGDKAFVAETAVRAVRGKLDDYFIRCRLAAFDSRATTFLHAAEAELAGMGPKDLSLAKAEIARLPLSRVEPGRALSLTQGLNPAWEEIIAVFVKDAVGPLLGPGKMLLSETDWQAAKASLAPFVAWLESKPNTKIETLGQRRIRELATGNLRQGITELIKKDTALADESNQIETVEKAILYRRDLVRLLRNFVNFSEFYSGGKAVFQVGTLYLDRRSCDLCLPVDDAGKHATLAGMAKAYLAYCDCTRKDGQKRGIVAVFTGGDTDNLFVGRNGVFFDRQGKDWDATITKIIENPISIRQAFLSPYKNFVRMVEAQAAKRAAAADQEARGKLETAALQTAHLDKTKIDSHKPEPKKMDIGTVAAIGVAVGGIGSFFAGLLGFFLGLGLWIPLGILSLILAISGPSMLIAWLKLRQRNLGPILDANGWAVNALARINVPFGGSLTKVALVPLVSRHQLKDPFATKRPPYGLYLLLILVALGALWSSGWVDTYVPLWARFSSIFHRGG